MIRGLVQGVGFRPFVYRLATGKHLKGRVDNRTDGVIIRVEGEEESFAAFREQLIKSPPAAANIKSIEVKPVGTTGFDDFAISGSRDEDLDITEISPDIAVCPECLEDLRDDPMRTGYPFINCTGCGPRFTIIEGLPYDRHKTSMKEFKMCPHCEIDYNNMLDRRFHAQPVACNHCGPAYSYMDENGTVVNFGGILKAVSGRIMDGRSVAVKGIGGYHLLCNALDENAVRNLRIKKQRDAKPFAVMFRDILSLEEYCHVSPPEFRQLNSWQRPVVILKEKKRLADSVSNGLGTIGAILPYMPLHYILFSYLMTPAIVMTSGNISEEPLIKDDEAAMRLLLPVTGAIATHNREIVNRADDSVMRLTDGNIILIRRSRGFVPSPVDIMFDCEGILAVGAEQKNTFCIGKKKQAIMSQYIGDLKNLPTFGFFRESLARFRSLFRFEPSMIACDLHPDYLSTQFARSLEIEYGLELTEVQHHHAHIASCMAENHLDEDIIGVCLDGAGYGTDGNIWGGEFLISSLSGFRRIAHFDYVPLPGGDKAVDEPWRMAFSCLYKYFGDEIDYDSIECFRKVDRGRRSLIKKMIDGKINSPLSSGAGRLFDAVSSLAGLCNISGFDSEAPIRLESSIKTKTGDYYPYEAGRIVAFRSTFESILKDIGKVDASVISVKFHNTLAKVISDVCLMIRKENPVGKVVLSGGVFQNSYLLGKARHSLENAGFMVYTNSQVPANDGGVSLGQLIVAAKLSTICA